MGSEMCIRDSASGTGEATPGPAVSALGHASGTGEATPGPAIPALGHASGTGEATPGPTCHSGLKHASGTTLGPAHQEAVELNSIHNIWKMFSQATRESIEESVNFQGANIVRGLALIATRPDTMEKKTQSSHNRMETMSYSFTLLLCQLEQLIVTRWDAGL